MKSELWEWFLRLIANGTSLTLCSRLCCCLEGIIETVLLLMEYSWHLVNWSSLRLCYCSWNITKILVFLMVHRQTCVVAHSISSGLCACNGTSLNMCCCQWNFIETVVAHGTSMKTVLLLMERRWDCVDAHGTQLRLCRFPWNVHHYDSCC